MKHKNKILAVLIVLSVIFVMGQVLGPVSAANGKIVDKGVADHKNYKSVKVNWTAKVHQNNKLEVTKYFSKNKTIFKIQKTTFTRMSRTKLKASTVVIQNKTTTKTSKYVKIKRFRTINSYYFKIHQPKLLKTVVASKSFDSGSGYLTNIAHGTINWNAKIYYNNKKVFIKENVSGIGSYLLKTTIERNGKNKLKITSYYVSDSSPLVYDSKTKKYVANVTKKIIYAKSKLSPKNYYWDVYRPKMLKHLDYTRDQFVMGPDTVKYSLSAYGNLKNSSGKMEWIMSEYYNGKVVVERNYTDNSFINSTTVIINFNDTALKISVSYASGNKSSQIYYVSYSYNPNDYYWNVYEPEMLKLIVGNGTVVGIKHYGFHLPTN